MKDSWLDSLVKLYEKKLHLGTDMMRGSKREKMEGYLTVLEDARQQVIEAHDTNLENILKQFYYDLYVIKEEDIPYSVYEREQRIARERGYGNLPITEEYKRTKASEIIRDQKETLDKWIEYFLWDEEAKNYSGWEVFWVLEGLQKLGVYDKEKHKYTKRDNTTVYPFPELNKQAVFSAIGMMEEYLKSKKSPEEVRAALGQANFKALYEYSLEQLMLEGKEVSLSTDGIWIKYDQGSDYHKLRDSLQGYRTGWCTAAGESFAESQLKGGDFYVYYTKDENGECKVPRIAIRMDGHYRICEIRGVEKDQNLEAEMLPVLDEKLKEFPDRENYEKKVHDTALLTEIDKKVNQGIELTIEELRFLYEIGYIIESFGWGKDPRIAEIRSKRNQKRDLSLIFNCDEKRIATDSSELDEETIAYCGEFLCCFDRKVHYPKLRAIIGDAIFQQLISAEGLESLEYIGGKADFNSLRSAEGLENLRSIGGNASFHSLREAKGLENLKLIGRDAFFIKLKSSKGLENLEYIGGKAGFNSLRSAEGLDGLKVIGVDAHFVSLKSSKGLESLKYIGREAFFNGLRSAESLKSLKDIGASANFDNLISAKGLEKLQRIGGFACFPCLKSAEGLESLQFIGKQAFFDGLTSAEGLDSLKTIGGDTYFRSLTNAEGLESLQFIGKRAFFDGLTSAEGLDSLETIGGDTYFTRLTSAEGLGQLQIIDGAAHFESLTSSKGLENLKKIGSDAIFPKLKSSIGLEDLQMIGGIANFDELITAEGLTGLQYIGRDAYFLKLTSSEGLNNLQYIGGNTCFSALTDAAGLCNLQVIGGRAYFDELTSAKGLENLQSVCDEKNPSIIPRIYTSVITSRVYFPSLTTSEGLENLKLVGGKPFDINEYVLTNKAKTV